MSGVHRDPTAIDLARQPFQGRDPDVVTTELCNTLNRSIGRGARHASRRDRERTASAAPALIPRIDPWIGSG